MRHLKRAVAVSFALNLFLAAAYWFGFPHSPGPVQQVVEEPISPQSSALVSEKTMTNTVTIAAPAKLLDWRTVESDDYKKYIANLRAVGCPEKTVRDVIIADVNELYRQRYRELFP